MGISGELGILTYNPPLQLSHGRYLINHSISSAERGGFIGSCQAQEMPSLKAERRIRPEVEKVWPPHLACIP